MGHRKQKHLQEVRQQEINKQENELYYQNHSEFKHPRSDRERTEHRKLNK